MLHARNDLRKSRVAIPEELRPDFPGYLTLMPQIAYWKPKGSDHMASEIDLVMLPLNGTPGRELVYSGRGLDFTDHSEVIEEARRLIRDADFVHEILEGYRTRKEQGQPGLIC